MAAANAGWTLDACKKLAGDEWFADHAAVLERVLPLKPDVFVSWYLKNRVARGLRRMAKEHPECVRTAAEQASAEEYEYLMEQVRAGNEKLYRELGASFDSELQVKLAQELTDTPNPWWSMWEQEGIEHWSAERYAEHVENLHRERSGRWGRLPVSRATREVEAMTNDFTLLSNLGMGTTALRNARLNNGVMSREEDTPEFYYSLQDSMRTQIKDCGALESLNNPKALFSKDYSFEIGNYPDSMLIKAFGTNKGTYFTDKKAQELFSKITWEHTALTAADRQAMDSLPASYREYLEEANDLLLREKADRERRAMAMLRQTPAAPDSLLLDSIVARYKGKAVVVDMWYTRCGWCIKGFQDTKAIRDELAWPAAAWCSFT